jgi:hypothetical protein
VNNKTKTANILLGVAICLTLTGIAWGAPCGDTAGPGGSNVPCSCGDTVVTNTLLTSPAQDPINGDPVVSTEDADLCDGDGLFIAPPNATRMALNLGGNTIRGKGAGIGITIVGTDVRVNIRNGRVRNFATGLTNVGNATGDARISAITVDNNVDGLHIEGNSHEIDGNQALDNTGTGVRVLGNSNKVQINQVSRSGANGIEVNGNGNDINTNRLNRNIGSGIVVQGDNNAMDHNTVENNGLDGIAVVGNGDGDPNTLELWKNKVNKNRGNGITVNGNNHEISANQANLNLQDGIAVDGTGNHLDTNVARENKGDGIIVTGTGNFDDGGNLGKKNGGVQCVIDGVNCIP